MSRFVIHMFAAGLLGSVITPNIAAAQSVDPCSTLETEWERRLCESQDDTISEESRLRAQREAIEAAYRAGQMFDDIHDESIAKIDEEIAALTGRVGSLEIHMETVEDVAKQAQVAADTAQTTANAAQVAADTAQTTANAAQVAADTAQTTANAAQVAADTAQTTANAAQVAADTAQTTANTAQVAAGANAAQIITIQGQMASLSKIVEEAKARRFRFVLGASLEGVFGTFPGQDSASVSFGAELGLFKPFGNEGKWVSMTLIGVGSGKGNEGEFPFEFEIKQVLSRRFDVGIGSITVGPTAMVNIDFGQMSAGGASSVYAGGGGALDWWFLDGQGTNMSWYTETTVGAAFHRTGVAPAGNLGTGVRAAF